MLLSYETVMIHSPRGWPSLADIKLGRVFMDEQLVRQVESLLATKANRCVIRGPEGRGKTVLARLVATRRYFAGWVVRIVRVPEVGEDRITEFISQATEATKHEKVLFVVEDAHNSVITPELVRFADEHSHCSYVFTTRSILPHQREEVIDPFEQWEDQGWVVDVSPDSEKALKIVETYAAAENIQYSFSQNDQSWLQRELGSDVVNLRRLRWYLEAWKKERGQLSSLTIKAVYRTVLSYYRDQLENNAHMETMLYRIAAVFQFDVDFYGGGYDSAILQLLQSKGIITSVQGDYRADYYRMQHSSDAACLLEAKAVATGEDGAVAFTAEVIKQYLQQRPRNYFVLLRALKSKTEAHSCLEEVLRDTQTFEQIFSMVEKDDVRVVLSVIAFMISIVGEEPARTVWLRYKQSLGQSAKDQKEAFQAKLRRASLLDICDLIKFFERFQADEKQWLIGYALDEPYLAQKMEEKTSSLGQIAMLLSLLPVREAKALFSQVDESHLIDKVSEATFRRFEEAFTKLPVKLRAIILSKLDLTLLAEKAMAGKSFDFSVFLHQCRNPLLARFSKLILQALHQKGGLLRLMRESEGIFTVSDWLVEIKKFDLQLYKHYLLELSPFWTEIWFKSSLSSIAKALLGNFARQQAETIRQVIVYLASSNLSDSIKRLYENPEARPMKTLGKLLYSVYHVSFNTNRNAVAEIAQRVVDEVNLRNRETYTLEEVSHLVTNVRRCSEVAWAKLCNKILLELDVRDQLGIPVKQGLSVLAFNFYQYRKEIGQQLIDRMFSLDFRGIVKESDPQELKSFFLNLLAIDSSRLRRSLQSVEDSTLLSRISQMSMIDALSLMLTLHCIDETRTKNILQSFANSLSSTHPIIDYKYLPLWGLLVYAGVAIASKVGQIDLCALADSLCEEIDVATIAFSVYSLRSIKSASVQELARELSRRLFVRNQFFPMRSLIETSTSDSIRKTVTAALGDFEISPEPETTLSNMIRLTHACQLKMGKTKVAANQLRSFLLDKTRGNPIFNSPKDFNDWLWIANEYDVLNIEKIPHHKNPSWLVNLVSLNKNNVLVSRTLQENDGTKGSHR